MGEKHTASKRGRSEKEKDKGKGKSKGSSSTPSDEIPERRYYARTVDFENFLAVKDKLIGPINCWDDAFLKKEHFDLLNDLNRLKLFDFSTYSDNIYPSLVKQFYGNLTKDGMGSMTALETLICGKPFSVTLRTLGEAFGMDYAVPIMRAGQVQEYSKAAAYNIFWGDQRPKFSDGKLQTTGMRFEDKLLQYTLVKVIFPKKSNIQHVDDDLLFLMWCIRSEIPINFPWFIMNHMIQHSRADFLPYGMVLTRLFKKGGVEVKKEESLTKFPASRKLSARHLHAMSYYKSGDAWQFVEKAAGQAGRGAPAAPAGFDMQALLDQMAVMHQETRDHTTRLFEETRAHFDMRMDSYGLRLDALEASVAGLRADHGGSSGGDPDDDDDMVI